MPTIRHYHNRLQAPVVSMGRLRGRSVTSKLNRSTMRLIQSESSNGAH